MNLSDLLSESEIQQLDELKAGKYAHIASLLGALAAQHGGKAADAATVGWKQQAPHALATLATYADTKKLGALPATLSSDELNRDEDELRRREKYRKIGRLVSPKDESLDEGVVARRGNKVILGSLELQLYPDHVFYVVNGGKEADLSIYKDGAFKPPRNNEIYLKDAGKHGVPDVFSKVIAKFFATQSIDDVVNDLETLYRNHVKKEDLDEGKYNELFLRGLVGAIMAGGISYGIDYAKEKTADLDKAGLHALYKSIDPHEYKQLTQKIPLKDKKGLNSILSKLKEHAMKMEDLDEGWVSISDPKTGKTNTYGKKPKEKPEVGEPGTNWQKHSKQGGSKISLTKPIEEGNKENKAKKKEVIPPKSRPKDKMSSFDPRKDLKMRESEYDGEGSFLKNELQTIARVATHLARDLDNDENVPTWVISKISQSKGMLVGAMDYMISKHERGIQPMDEEEKDWSSRYRVGCTLVDRNSPAASNRNKKIFKNVWVRAEDEFDAKKVAQIYYRKKGYSVINCEITTPNESMSEEKQRLDAKCWKGYRKAGTKMKGGVRVNNCVKSGK